MIKWLRKMFKPKYKIPEKSFAEMKEEISRRWYYKPENNDND